VSGEFITVVKTFPVGEIFETGFPTTVDMLEVFGTVSLTESKSTLPVSANGLVDCEVAPGAVVSYPRLVPALKVGKVGGALLSIAAQSLLGVMNLIC